ncbi:4871_t:CDS:2 [Dentiscutata heterogama]|uniref:4871_t:CDS:1 n=1 Tax=Dentiscutata heterogama TaxID=1316150 RepID=A0ACA9P504_9GLOM|nr:4871_t:CDS:2 [Dentiscutata heterogama]
MQSSFPSSNSQNLVEASSINMDILTQLQDSIDSISRMFFVVVHHLNTQDPSKSKDAQQEHVQDICKKAKQIELLIDALPGINHSEAEQIEILKSLDQELKAANEEYIKAVQDAGMIQKSLIKTFYNNNLNNQSISFKNY